MVTNLNTPEWYKSNLHTISCPMHVVITKGGFGMTNIFLNKIPCHMKRQISEEPSFKYTNANIRDLTLSHKSILSLSKGNFPFNLKFVRNQPIFLYKLETKKKVYFKNYLKLWFLSEMCSCNITKEISTFSFGGLGGLVW